MHVVSFWKEGRLTDSLSRLHTLVDRDLVSVVLSCIPYAFPTAYSSQGARRNRQDRSGLAVLPMALQNAVELGLRSWECRHSCTVGSTYSLLYLCIRMYACMCKCTEPVLVLPVEFLHAASPLGFSKAGGLPSTEAHSSREEVLNAPPTLPCLQADAYRCLPRREDEGHTRFGCTYGTCRESEGGCSSINLLGLWTVHGDVELSHNKFVYKYVIFHGMKTRDGLFMILTFCFGLYYSEDIEIPDTAWLLLVQFSLHRRLQTGGLIY